MKTSHGNAKGKGGNAPASSIASRTRKMAPATAASRKRLRRLHRPPEDDEDDEVEEELGLSPESSSSSSERKKSGDEKDAIFENPLVFVDYDGDGGSATEMAPIVSSVCDRDFDQHPLQSDELDQLQFELEKSLTQAVFTQRKLRLALKQLTTTGGGQGGSSTRGTSSAVSNKRKFPKNQTIAKKPSAGVSTSMAPTPAAKKNRPLPGKDRRLLNHESPPSCSRSYYYAQQNHQMPDKFWAFIDQYTGPLTSDDDVMETLRTLVRESDPDSSQTKAYYEIPESKNSKRRPSSAASSNLSPRGNSHSAKAAAGSSAKANQKSKGASTVGSKRDPSPVKEEEAPTRTLRGTASPAAQPKKRGATTTQPTPAAKKAREDAPRTRNGASGNAKGQSGAGADKNGILVGPLTERLVQALLEDCANGSGDLLNDRKNGQSNAVADLKNGLSSASNTKLLMKTLNLSNLKAVENRIRKELIEQGILDPTDDQPMAVGKKTSSTEHSTVSRRDSKNSIAGRSSALSQYEECPDDDEVTAELKRRQYELMCVQHTNHERLTSLLAKAENQAERMQKEETLRAADDEVLELCARYYGVAPTSRKPSNKKERDTLWKALKDREKAVTKLKACH